MGTDDHNVEAGTMNAGSGRPPASGHAFPAGAAAARSPVALPREQRRARGIAMGKAELDTFLTKQRTCRVATASQDGPHLTPLWYVWDETALWLYSVVRSQRWTDISRDRRVAVLVDAGHAYGELRGAELRGAVEIMTSAETNMKSVHERTTGTWRVSWPRRRWHTPSPARSARTGCA